ncbi:hypothetical protein L2E82_31351 [Cichorium intybus]|uniref:Uncharacterized protein n=1 Tax=Cichorium intybus TaxID=13427 RepID=A0ACB9D3A7_CICIN|nr:hypothetical protein L2E82_31351 [Cichorium intybus]
MKLLELMVNGFEYGIRTWCGGCAEFGGRRERRTLACKSYDWADGPISNRRSFPFISLDSRLSQVGTRRHHAKPPATSSTRVPDLRSTLRSTLHFTQASGSSNRCRLRLARLLDFSSYAQAQVPNYSILSSEIEPISQLSYSATPKPIRVTIFIRQQVDLTFNNRTRSPKPR